MPATIVLVEDEETEAAGLSALIESWGYKCCVARDGINGLLLARQLRPTIVITGIQMPGIDGFELIERLRNEKVQAKIVVLSGFHDPTAVVKAVKLGAEEFLSKPVNLTELHSTLRRLVPPSEGQNALIIPIGTTLAEAERKLILATLQQTQNNKTRAAEILGISLKTLHNKLNEYREAGFIQ